MMKVFQGTIYDKILLSVTVESGKRTIVNWKTRSKDKIKVFQGLKVVCRLYREKTTKCSLWKYQQWILRQNNSIPFGLDATLPSWILYWEHHSIHDSSSACWTPWKSWCDYAIQWNRTTLIRPLGIRKMTE